MGSLTPCLFLKGMQCPMLSSAQMLLAVMLQSTSYVSCVDVAVFSIQWISESMCVVSKNLNAMWLPIEKRKKRKPTPEGLTPLRQRNISYLMAKPYNLGLNASEPP